MSGSPDRRPLALPVALSRRSPMSMLVAVPRGRAPVTLFDARSTLAGTLETAAQHLAVACYAVDVYRERTGEVVEIAEEVRTAITALSRLSLNLMPAGRSAGTRAGPPGIPGE